MIEIVLNQNLYEQDLRPLFMAFFPGEPITVRQPEEKEGVWDRQLLVIYREKTVKLCWQDRQGTLAEDQTQVDYSDYKETKNRVKRMLYTMLSQYTGKKMPWGSLTGIRPTKIAMGMLEQGIEEKEILRHYEEEYFCSRRKAEMSLEIAKRERELLSRIDYEDGYSLYIGIPFCPTTCLYCSFTSYPISKWVRRVDEYLDALEKEIDFTAEHFENKKLNTVYFGGGTPTTLTAEQLERILSKVNASFDLRYLQEFTVEAGRPDSVTREKLDVLKRQGVTRISINPQTMKQETLKIIGRQHTVEQVKSVFAMAREAGFTNINMDIILGLPNETLEDVTHTMEELSLLHPDNITVHSLALKRAAKLNIFKEAYQDYRMENSDAQINLTEDYARALGMNPYYLYRQKNMSGNLENVGYAIPGKEGLYNILIMEEKQTIVALGAGATTKAVFGDRIERCENVKDIKTYLEKLEEMLDRKRRLFGFEQ